jgi:hypothetical protein
MYQAAGWMERGMGDTDHCPAASFHFSIISKLTIGSGRSI